MRRPCTKKAAPAEQRGIWRNYLQAQECGPSYVKNSSCCKGNTGAQRPEEREFVVDSGALMHMMNEIVLSCDALDTLRRSRNPSVVLTANGEVHTNEEAQVFVHDLNLSSVCEIFLIGWRSSQIIQRTQNCMHPHTLLRTQIRNVLRKWHQNQGSTVSFLTSQKTEIVKSALQNDNGSLQKTHWRSSTSSRNVW